MLRLGLDVGDQPVEGEATVKPELAPNQVSRLDAVGAFVNRRDSRIAEVLGGAGFLDIAHPAVHLDAKAGDLAADIGAPGFGHGRQHISSQSRQRVAARGAVDLAEGVIDQGPRSHRQRSHSQQHPANVGMIGDRLAVLAAFERISDRALGGAFGDPDALKRYVEAGIVHHREHRAHPLILATDHPAGRAAGVAIAHHAGR